MALGNPTASGVLCSMIFQVKHPYVKCRDRAGFFRIGKTQSRLGLSILVAAICLFAHSCFAQSADSTQTISHYAVGVTVTDNGISLIPTFSLGKPAAIFDLSLKKRRLSFEPQLRFSLEGKPWSFIFWWRYKLLKTPRFSLNIGTHPSLVFKTLNVNDNGTPTALISAKRYWASEFVPSFSLSKNVSIGAYYLYSHGLDEGTILNTHFLTLNAHFSNIPLFKGFYLRYDPQVYYLKMDQQDGFYVCSTLTLAKRNCPFSISSIINKAIQTRISASKDVVWNLSLTYAFHKAFVEK